MIPKTYFYIPSGESLWLLYELYNKYGKSLVVISDSRSIKSLSEILGIEIIVPNISKDFFPYLNIEDIKISVIKEIFTKIKEYINVFFRISNILRVIKSVEKSSRYYHSVFLYDTEGLLLLNLLINKKFIRLRLIWPNKFRFNAYKKPNLFSMASLLNLLFGNVYCFHFHELGVKVIGINPDYLTKKKIKIHSLDSERNHSLSIELKKKVYEEIFKNFQLNRIRILFLGSYSVENGIEEYGEVYKIVLRTLGDLNQNPNYSVFYKPHIDYHSISHPLLNSLNVIKEEIPVELLDVEKSWDYVIGFSSATYKYFHSTKMISLLDLYGIFSYSFDLSLYKKWIVSLNPNTLFPKNIEELSQIILSKVSTSNLKYKEETHDRSKL